MILRKLMSRPLLSAYMLVVHGLSLCSVSWQQSLLPPEGQEDDQEWYVASQL